MNKLDKVDLRRLSEAEDSLIQLYWYMVYIQEDVILTERVIDIICKIQALKRIRENKQ